MPKSVRFTKEVLDDFQCPEGKAEAYLQDTGQPGLLFRVRASGHRSFEVRRKLNGRASRSKIGNYPGTKIADARKQAREALSHYDRGVHPDAAKRAERAATVTLKECLDDYLNSRSSLKESTRSSYEATLNQYLSEWLDQPLKQITRDDVETKHRVIGSISETRANTTMRILRAVFNYAIAKYEDENGEPIFVHNPVARLSHVKAWYPESRRRSYLTKQQIRQWFGVVNTLPDWMSEPRSDPETIRDFLILIFFTGLRRREASNLKWQEVDLENRTLTISSNRTKNKQEHVLPLPNYLFDLLNKRYSEIEEFVFPGQKDGFPLAEPKRVIQAIRERSDIQFTIHDLRRTFATMAEDAGIRDYTLKRLLNHSGGRDVTAGYYVPDVQALREPMQKICDHLLNIAAVRIT